MNRPLITITNDANLPADQVRAFVDMINDESTVDQKDLPEDDRMRIIGQQASKLFTLGVGFLRNPANVPCKPVNDLMEHVWCIVGNQVVRVVMNNALRVPTISFVALGDKGSKGQAFILLPENYVEQVQKNAVGAFGGLVFVGSQARDFYNERFNPQDSLDIQERAKGYEAEYFKAIKKRGEDIGHPLELQTDYERWLVKRYVSGLNSIPDSLLYEPIEPPPAR